MVLPTTFLQQMLCSNSLTQEGAWKIDQKETAQSLQEYLQNPRASRSPGSTWCLKGEVSKCPQVGQQELGQTQSGPLDLSEGRTSGCPEPLSILSGGAAGAVSLGVGTH